MFKAIGAGVAWALARLESAGADDAKKTHFVTLSFDDGFKKSSLRTAEIYEKYGLSRVHQRDRDGPPAGVCAAQ